MSLKFTVTALLIANVAATRCGDLKVTKCTDADCSAGCTTQTLQPPGCGNSFLADVEPYGTVGTTCNWQKTTFKFYTGDDCTGGNYRVDKEYYYETCYPDPSTGGSMKMIPTGDAVPFYDLTEQEYEERFNQRWQDTSDFNVLGYGSRNQFVPPIRNPTWLVNELDRYLQVISSAPLASFFHASFLRALGVGDTLRNGYWYNNAEASGQQLYPQGLNKYFDMFSIPGWINYTFYWIWYMIVTVMSPLTLGVPLNIWLGILNGMSFKGFWKAFVPFPFIWLFHLRGENGWILA